MATMFLYTFLLFQILFYAVCSAGDAPKSGTDELKFGAELGEPVLYPGQNTELPRTAPYRDEGWTLDPGFTRPGK
ncbi:uncharacterized protein Dmoj_GI26717, isoform C [Drosophila mojavensis]|uniref:Uncharacterized protein, isoform C n=2 Tax=Drosophila mojavensis TaxID=7230 RepID=A0A0Q9XE02_DROMO|nr:uncharacterized protein Dmoj_GI26717, isoform C [Drosophila mojavensis]